MHTGRDNPEAQLGSVNQRLSGLLGSGPLDLGTGGVRTLTDTLWVWGVVGGKDVGKSTLIDALAGAKVVDHGVAIGEGTFQPACYFHAADADALRSRLGRLDGMNVTHHAVAPLSMRGLVLVDLPDFDSLYTDHVARVRRIAGVLDGVIWVTTPKKVGDSRAIHEIGRVLKARGNFVYVVNKMDWLLAQSDQDPAAELDRVLAALEMQVTDCDTNGHAHRSFMVSAKHRTKQAILEEIAHAKGQPDAEGKLSGSVERIVSDFDALRLTLTQPPTPDQSLAGKRANLDYQIRSQARELIVHHKPRDVLDRMDRLVGPESIAELASRALPLAYVGSVLDRLGDDSSLFGEWSTELFRRRIARWSLLGVVAWPVMLIGVLVRRMASLIPTAAPRAGDAFRMDGLTIEDRMDGVLTALGARCAQVSDGVDFALPDRDALAAQIRAEADALVKGRRSATIEPLLRRKPTLIGRLVRRMLPPVVLVWFALAQPVLAAILDGWTGTMGLEFDTIRKLVHALSGGTVLVGVGVSALILIGLAAAVYSSAVRDTLSALDRLAALSPDEDSVPLVDITARSLGTPIAAVRGQLEDATATVEALMAGAVRP